MKLKTLVPVLALAALMSIPSMAFARPVHDFSCDLCHKVGANLSDLSQIICLDCHTTGHESDTFPFRLGGGSTNPVGNATFVAGDASDALGSTSAAGVVPGKETSHNWGASDNKPAAGASAPTDSRFYGRSNYSGATVSCSRCHDPHGELDGTPRAPANPQLLKLGVNSADAMCIDCHKDWDQTANNGHLTHPLQTNYAAFQAANPTKYKPFTPTGELALDASGNMTCTTCHGTHFVDSDATTSDGAGNVLSSGDGKLLKGSGVLTGDKTSLCTSCHVYKGHGASGIGCLDCHSGHSYNGGTPNYYVLRDNVSLSAWPAGAPANPGTGLAYTSMTYPWKNSGNGYCEGCHTLPAAHNGFATGTVGECSSCHTHDDSNASFTAGDCTACHGYPPVANTAGGPDGYAVDAGNGYNYSTDPNFKNESQTAHARHAGSAATQYKIACSECHAGNTHDAGTFQDVFNAPTSFVTAGGLSPAYAKAGNGTCSAVYCHSNGGARGAAPVAATIPAWQNGVAATCASCHGNDAATMTAKANSAAHQKHLAKGYDCSLCHVNTAANATTLATGAIQGIHVNGAADVAFNPGSSLTQLGGMAGTYSAATGTCNTIYCHSDGTNAPAITPDWDLSATGACGSCHNVTGETLPGAHNKHVFAADGPQLACNTCHTHNGLATDTNAADHVNGFKDTIVNLQTAVCNSCHGVDTGETAPVWATPTTANCVSCHTGASLSTIGVQAPDKSTALTTGHNLASGNYPVSANPAANRTCEACHDATQPHLTGTGNLRLQAGFDCTSCHSTMNTHQGNSCLECHDPHGTTNIYMVKSVTPSYSGTVTFTATTGANSYDETDSVNADDICATCHSSANGTTHNNKENTGIHAGGAKTGQDCFTCHLPHSDAAAFGVGAGTSCDGCHGFPPVSGVHAQHSITSGNTIATSDRSDCAVCHTGAESYTYDPTADQVGGFNHSNSTNRPGIITTAVGYNTTDKTCSTACHVSTLGNGGTWTAGATLACDACHYYSTTPTSAENTAAAGRALTGTHNTHFDANKTCDDCHTVPTAGDVTHNTVAPTGTDAEKIQGLAVATMDEADILGTVGSDSDPGNATCSNIACHDASDDGHTATWTVANAVGCAFCHSDSDPATANHSAHLSAAATFGVTIACTDCHADNGTNNAHLNGTVDMAGKVSAFTSPNCTNSCHQDGRTGAAAVTATWGMVPQANCTICHIQQPATGSHGKHLANMEAGAISCADCHDNTVDNATAASQHLDLNIDAFDATPADLGYPADKVLNTPFTTCNAAACHSDGRNNLVTTPVWGTPSACAECHAEVPATGSHTAHMGVSGVTCSDCHTGTTQGTTAGAGHRDNNIDTAAALGYTQNKTIASAFETCATASCHDNGLGVAVASPVWGTAINNCSECHLNQPGTGSHTVHLSSGATCGSCHDGAVQGTTAPALHGNNLVDVYDVNPSDLGYPQGVAKGIGTWTTCNATSCHNNGQSGLDTDLGNVGASNVTTPVWGTTSVCAECHVATPTSAKHDEHLGSYGSTCGDCHAGAVAGSNGGTNHRDGLISVGSKAIYNAAGTPGNGWGSCTNSATGCHPGQTRNWDATGPSCNSCHGASSAGTGEPLVAGDMLSTNPLGQHNTHVNSGGMNCATCHNGGHNETNGLTGQDDTLQISFSGTLAAGGSYNPPGTWTTGKWLYSQTSTTATQDCSNLYCHSSGQADGGIGAPTYATPDWGNAASGACGTCHATSPATGSHTAHLADSADCNNCHSGNTHVNKSIEVTSVTYTSAGAPGNGYGSCSTASCHDDGTGALVATPTWGTTSACNECHAAAPTTNSHPIHLALSGVTCGTCHQGALEGSNAGVAHRDGTLNTVAALGYSDSTKGAPYGTCSTASCHDDGLGNPAVTPVWGTDVTNCSTCHATAPTTGTHTAHFNDGAVCNQCHAGAIEGSTAPTNHLSGFVDIDGTPLNGYANNPAALGSASWTTCSTASCHVTGQAAGDYAVTPAWGTNAANCSQCHLASPTTGSHAKHITATGDCTTCHTGAVKDSSYSVAAHRDDNVDVAVGGYTANKPLGSAAESCASISCHSDGLTGTSGTSPVWGTVTPNCTACHDAAPTTGSHTAHLADSATCNNCHNDAVESITAPTAIHTDGDVDVFNTAAGDLGYPQNAAIGSGSWSTCNAASCHDDGTGSLVITPAWGTPSTCNECHSNVPTTNAHGTHLALAGVNCGTCHSGAVQDVNPGGTHRNGSVEVLFGYTDTTKGAPYGTCSTASCHNNGLGVSVASPAWNGSSNCSSCHTTPPATGSHSIHLSNTEAGTISCGNCHRNATPSVSPTGVHANGNVDVFDATAGDLGYPTTAALGSASWTTCNAASCHDNGTGTLVTTPAWGQPAACTECHTTVPATGAHTTHLGQTITSAINCTDCHNGAVWGSATPTTGHRDGNVDVSGGYGYPLNKTKGSAYASCNTSYCHGDAMPKGTTSGTTNAPNWGASSTGCTFCHDMAPAAIGAHAGKTATDCITCHDNTNAAGTGFVDKNLHINGTLEGGGDNCFDCHANVGSGLSGAHAAHNTVPFAGLLSNGDYGSAAAGWYNVTYTNGKPSFGCGFCHPSTVAGHMTKQTSLNPADAGAAGTLKAKNAAGAAYVPATGVCSASYCHSDGANVASSASPAWNATISGNCNDCHGNSPTTNAHSVHSVGIHYTDLYDSDRTGVMQAAAATNAAHGNSVTSTTITCVICHGDTVTLTQNDQNDVCSSCHSGATTKGNLGINTATASHLNGQPDVVFNLSGFKTTAQLRDDITGVTELNTNWTRTNGYKQAAGTSHDAAKAVAPNFSAGTCSAIVCHNGNSANWSDPVAGDCQKCHTALPQ